MVRCLPLDRFIHKLAAFIWCGRSKPSVEDVVKVQCTVVSSCMFSVDRAASVRSARQALISFWGLICTRPDTPRHVIWDALVCCGPVFEGIDNVILFKTANWARNVAAGRIHKPLCFLVCEMLRRVDFPVLYRTQTGAEMLANSYMSLIVIHPWSGFTAFGMSVPVDDATRNLRRAGSLHTMMCEVRDNVFAFYETQFKIRFAGCTNTTPFFDLLIQQAAAIEFIEQTTGRPDHVRKLASHVVSTTSVPPFTPVDIDYMKDRTKDLVRLHRLVPDTVAGIVRGLARGVAQSADVGSVDELCERMAKLYSIVKAVDKSSVADVVTEECVRISGNPRLVEKLLRMPVSESRPVLSLLSNTRSTNALRSLVVHQVLTRPLDGPKARRSAEHLSTVCSVFESSGLHSLPARQLLNGVGASKSTTIVPRSALPAAHKEQFRVEFHPSLVPVINAAVSAAVSKYGPRCHAVETLGCVSLTLSKPGVGEVTVRAPLVHASVLLYVNDGNSDVSSLSKLLKCNVEAFLPPLIKCGVLVKDGVNIKIAPSVYERKMVRCKPEWVKVSRASEQELINQGLRTKALVMRFLKESKVARVAQLVEACGVSVRAVKTAVEQLIGDEFIVRDGELLQYN